MLVFLILTLTAIKVYAQIGISPPRTEFSLDGPASTHSIRVFNVGHQPVDVAVDVNNWELDENNEVVIIPPTEQSLDQWLIINPLTFTLEPGGTQVVRLAARPRVKPEPGEHRALIYFRQIPPSPDPNTALQPQVLFRLGTSVIGLAEPVIREAIVHSVTADQTGIRIDLESLGNTHVRLDGQWALWPAEIFPGRDQTGLVEGLGNQEGVELPDGMIAAWLLNSLPVLPGSRRLATTVIDAELEPGNYVLDVHGSVGGEDVGRTFEIEVGHPPENSESDPVVDEKASDEPEATKTSNSTDQR